MNRRRSASRVMARPEPTGIGALVLLACTAVLLVAAGPLAGQDLLVRGAQVMTMSEQGTLESGDVLIRDGRIAQVGHGLSAPAGVRVLEGDGWVIMPGMIDCHSHMTTQLERGGGSDRHERGQRVNTGLRILDAVNPAYGWLVPGALAGGVTTLHVMPGSNASFGGQTLLLKAVEKPTVDEMLVREPVGMKMSMGATRGAGTSEMREWFTKGQEYLESLSRWEEGDGSGREPRRDLQLEGVGMQLTGEIQTHTHAQRAIEMQYALKMAREFGLDLVLHHAFDGWKIADDIQRQDQVSVCFGPIVHSFANDHLWTPGILSEMGVKVALNMDSASSFQRHLLHSVQIAVRYGMDPMEGLRSVTTNPAEMLGVGERLGSLEEGKDGDLVVLDGDPLSTFTNVLYTVVDGEVVYDRDVHGDLGVTR